MNQARKTDYCTLWNFMDILSIISSALFVICIFTEIIDNVEYLRLMATFSCFMLQLKLFDWLRLFDSTAPLIMLLLQAIEDI